MGKKEMTHIEREICSAVQGDIPLVRRPFAKMAMSTGIEEGEFIKRLKGFMDKGYVRRFGATLRHRKAGVKANGMGVWKVPDGEQSRVGEIMSSFDEVTHCYERPSFPDWDYNIFTMIHGGTREECHEIAKRISEATGITEYRLLFSSREFKKVSMTYF